MTSRVIWLCLFIGSHDITRRVRWRRAPISTTTSSHRETGDAIPSSTQKHSLPTNVSRSRHEPQGEPGLTCEFSIHVRLVLRTLGIPGNSVDATCQLYNPRMLLVWLLTFSLPLSSQNVPYIKPEPEEQRIAPLSQSASWQAAQTQSEQKPVVKPEPVDAARLVSAVCDLIDF